MGIGANPARPQGGGRRLTEGANRGIAVLAGSRSASCSRASSIPGTSTSACSTSPRWPGSAAAVVLAVTAATLPLLWRTMRPEALRTE
jgi:hypothetical protein